MSAYTVEGVWMDADKECPSDPTHTMCPSSSPDNRYGCTLVKGHDGPHIGTGGEHPVVKGLAKVCGMWNA